MSVIDADTHVDECEDTWKKLEGTPYAKYIPLTIFNAAGGRQTRRLKSDEQPLLGGRRPAAESRDPG